VSKGETLNPFNFVLPCFRSFRMEHWTGD